MTPRSYFFGAKCCIVDIGISSLGCRIKPPRTLRLGTFPSGCQRVLTCSPKGVTCDDHRSARGVHKKLGAERTIVCRCTGGTHTPPRCSIQPPETGLNAIRLLSISWRTRAAASGTPCEFGEPLIETGIEADGLAVTRGRRYAKLVTPNFYTNGNDGSWERDRDEAALHTASSFVDTRAAQLLFALGTPDGPAPDERALSSSSGDASFVRPHKQTNKARHIRFS